MYLINGESRFGFKLQAMSGFLLKNKRNQGFSHYFCSMIEESGSGSVPRAGNDPGGPKYGSYGSGSATLLQCGRYRKFFNLIKAVFAGSALNKMRQLQYIRHPDQGSTRTLILHIKKSGLAFHWGLVREKSFLPVDRGPLVGKLLPADSKEHRHR